MALSPQFGFDGALLSAGGIGPIGLAMLFAKGGEAAGIAALLMQFGDAKIFGFQMLSPEK